MQYHLAQVNIGRIKGVNMEDPIMKDFADMLDEINTLAESSVGFVWRLKGDGNNATDLKPFDDDRIIVNMSVWESIDALKNYVYDSKHVEVMKRRREWFERFGKPFLALWYVPVGHEPTVEEAKERLQYIENQGFTPYSFDFRQPFSVEEYIAFSSK
jgi:heme-degrading monooxygenase HmoA